MLSSKEHIEIFPSLVSYQKFIFLQNHTIDPGRSQKPKNKIIFSIESSVVQQSIFVFIFGVKFQAKICRKFVANMTHTESTTQIL